MSQTKTILTAIIEFILGKKYYANIIATNGTGRCEITSHIHRTKQDAAKHRQAIAETRSFTWIETVSFRSYQNY